MTKIVASCPHCFNTLANEYPDFGGRYEVVHHSELLADLVREGRLRTGAGDAPITYHDSCYLARHNDVLDAPRDLVASIGRPLEMARSGKRTFCCGAGGAHMWMEERGNQINEERAREAAATGAETLAVACPFCTVMLDDGVRQTGSELRVADVSTLLVEALESSAARRAERSRAAAAAAAVACGDETTSRPGSRAGKRYAGPWTWIAAIALPRASRIGAATESIPSANSSRPQA